MKEGWKYKKLGEVCDIIGGGTPSKKNTAYYEGNIPWATVRDMNCNVLSKTEFKISEEGFNDSASHIIKKGEIIIATRVGLGKVCKLAQDTAINQDLKGIIPKKYDIIRDFIFYFFKSRAKFIEENGVGATVKGVKIKFVEDLLFPIIPLKEQQRIVSRLDAAFSHIEEIKANAQKQLSEARALFQKSLAKALEPKEDWKFYHLQDICTDVVDCPHTTPRKVDKPTIYPCIRTSELRGGQIDWKTMQYLDEEEYKKRTTRIIPKENDIVYGREGTYGDAALLPKGYCFSLGQRTMLLRPNVDLVYPEFLLNMLISTHVYEQAKAKNSGCGVGHVNVKDIKVFKIYIPPLSEQQRIVERLDALSVHVRELEENQKKIISECDALKQALLRKVFE